MLFARKVRQGRWLALRPAGKRAGADLLDDFRTSGNELSVWRIRDDQHDLDDIFVAIAAAAEPSNVDVLLIPAADLDSIGITWRRSEGQTPYSRFAGAHYDLVDLSPHDLATLVEQLRDQPSDDDLALVRRQRKDVLELIVARVRSGDISIYDLQERMQGHVAEALDP